MKKTYITPNLDIIKVKASTHLLAGSNPNIYDTPATGNDWDENL